MDIKEFDFTQAVHIDKDLDLPGIASFNPMYDKITDEVVVLPMPKKQIILDQGGTNSCVGHSMVMCAALLHYGKTNKWINFDPFAVYGTVYPGQWSGLGMYPHEAIDNCIRDGFFFKRDFGKVGERPAITTEVNKFKSEHPDLVAKAKDYNFSAKAMVRTWVDVRAALRMGLPVSATWSLYDSFFTTGSDGKTPIPNRKKERFLGNHQMTIAGITKNNEYIVLNSYGVGRAFRGLYYIPFDYTFEQAFSVSDTIMPALKKAKTTILTIGNRTINVDGTNVVFDVAPYISDDGRTMVPIRVISEALGASVDYQVINNQQVITIRSEEGEITLMIGRKSYSIDGKMYNMDCAPVIYNDRTMVPIRFISEALNCTVDWDANTKKVTITCL